MKILHLLSQTQLTGAEVHARELGRAHAARGHEIFTVSDKIHSEVAGKFVSQPIHGARGLERWRGILWLRRFLKDNSVDVVHAHSRAAVRWGYWATLGTRTALVSTVHGRQHASLGKRLWDQYGEQVLCVCENLRRHLLHDFKMKPDRLHVVGNPVRWLGAPASRDGVSSWLWAGRLTGPKGEAFVELLKGPLAKLLRENPSVKFTVWGGQLDDLGIEGRRVFETLGADLGSRLSHRESGPGLMEALPRFDLVIGAGRVAIEALGLGLPVLAIGESGTHGLVTTASWDEAVASNFGDVGIETGLRLDLSLVEAALRDFGGGRGPSVDERERLASRARAVFGVEHVARRVEEAYRSAVFKKHFARPIPILMYHKVVPEPLDTPHRIFVTTETFEAHMKALSESGRVALSFADLAAFKDGRRPWNEFPKNPIVITFDDGYVNNLEIAAPLLRKYGMKATIFLLADHGLRSNAWDEGSAPQLPLMNADERRRLLESGVFEIGSHGFRHERITAMDPERALHELRDSKKVLENEFGRPVDAFAYTYGDTSPLAAALAFEAGYRYGVNTDTGGLVPEDNPWSVFRTSVFPEDTASTILKKTRPSYRIRYRWTRGK